MLKLIGLVSLAWACVACAPLNPPTAIATGTVRYAGTEQPVGQALVWTTDGPALRMTYTDTAGHFRLDSLRPGTKSFEVVCPGYFATAPVATVASLSVREGIETRFNPVISASNCEPKPSRVRHVHWRGHYSGGFEESSFAPCPSDSLAIEVRSYGHPFRRHAWVSSMEAEWRAPKVGHFVPDGASGYVGGFVEWSGQLTGPRLSGHMGMANYDLVVDSIFAIASSGKC